MDQMGPESLRALTKAGAAQPLQPPRSVRRGGPSLAVPVAAGECLSIVDYISSDLLPRGSWLIVYQNQLLPPVALLPPSAPLSCELQAEADLRAEEAESA